MPVSWTVSHLPGRLRLRHPTLRQASRNEALQATLRGWDGVLSVTGNPATGGVLIHYDPVRFPPVDMEARVAATLGAPDAGKAEEAAKKPAAFAPRKLNRAAKIGMLGSLSGTLLALAVGKKLHAAFGVAHLAFLTVHLATHRKQLLR
ncbi:HMA2 domain-containing protein [Azospirillum doebereinerae]|uniref:HMA2 domain-containing protein n=1 Tax=Azospirillum doebereinerae TaxID=92933 RepID=UPI001EE55DC5|nr:hypothetical protein [Azospirillum doebereinerae]MCG5243818.1 hypothetical protein [Azospirillum doebereinerae]